MAHFTFTCYEEDNTDSSLSFDADYLGDVLEKFEQFLKGAGYHFEGNLEFVTNDYDEYDDSDEYVEQQKKVDYSYQSAYQSATPNILIDQIKALTTADIASLNIATVNGSGTIPGYGAVPPTMSPLQPLTKKDLDKWSL